MYTPPTIASLKAQIIADIEGEIGQAAPILPRAFVRVLAKALAGVLASLYRRNLWAYLQIFPQTCDEEVLAYYEDRYGITPSPSIPAVLTLEVSGDDDTLVPAGTYLTSPDNGLVYSTALAVTIAGGVASVQAQCLTAGEASTLALSSTLSLVPPIAGISGATVTAVTQAGQDADTLDERRAQVLERMRRTDEIGTSGWYISKALEVPGVAFARVTRNSGGDVTVYPLLGVTGAARIPDASMLATIQAYLQDQTRRPLAANVYTLATVERTATLTITGVSPNDATTKAAIEAAWQAYCYAAYPRQYTDDQEPTDIVSLGAIWSLIVANGAIATGAMLTISGIGSGVTSYTLPIGEIIAPGAITWA